jgi:hypothetical protein
VTITRDAIIRGLAVNRGLGREFEPPDGSAEGFYLVVLSAADRAALIDAYDDPLDNPVLVGTSSYFATDEEIEAYKRRRAMST